MSNSKFLYVCLAILSLTFTAVQGHSCQHDAKYVEPDLMDVDEILHGTEEHRHLSSSGYPYIRLSTNYDYLTGGTSAFRSYVEYDLVPPVVSYFQNAVMVKNPLKTALKVNAGVTKVCEYAPPSILKTTGVNADHFFYFAAIAEENDYVATAMYCQLATDTKRPIISRVFLNTNYLKVPNGDVLVHESNTYTLMHEMTHAFGFSYNLFQYYLDTNGVRMTNQIKKVNLNGSTRTVLNVASLTARAQSYFGCSSLPGVYMEQNGDATLTANSHLERRFFLMDYMNAGYLNSARVTEMSLGVLEASGWYAINYDYAEPNYFGAGQGCAFINDQCGSKQIFSEFCVVTKQRGCFVAGRGGGFCEADTVTDGCMYHSPSINFDCRNSAASSETRLSNIQSFGSTAGSKCFDGTLSTVSGDKQDSFCFTYTCIGSGSNTQVAVQVGNKRVTCSEQGTVSVSGYEGTLNCPDPLTFCSTVGKAYCQRNCMGRGTCGSNGQCNCYSGYTGIDCSERV